MAGDRMDISIVVPTFNRREMVFRTLSTLFAQNYPVDQFEIIVVIDGSSDGTAERLKDLKPPCQLRVIEQQNRGPAGARNSGYRAATSGLVLFLDDDMLCDPGLIAAHIAAHRQAVETVGHGAVFLSADSPPGLAAECFNREIGAFHLEHLKEPKAHWNENACVFSNTSVSKQLLCNAGGFDESFRVREDLDLGIRLIALGAIPQYVSDAIAYQLYTKSPASLLLEAEKFAAADMLFAKKHPGLRVYGHGSSTAEGSSWKPWMRRAAASSTLLEQLVLAPLCFLGQRFFSIPLFREIGVRALRARRRIHWLRVTQQLEAGEDRG